MTTARSRLDEKMMRLALAMARRGNGRVYPNPSVGAVVYRGDRILGKGRTQPPGGAHAEVAAIAAARCSAGDRALRGASIAVTLEPCSFTGRTGPCTEAIAAAGLRRVVAGLRDPHEKVSGRGFAQLRRRGIELVTDVLAAECAWQHRGFVSVCERGRPHVTLKLAASLDGRIALASGESRWITGEAARAFVHRLRDQHDAVLVGSETALADDPELTVRRGDRFVRRPVRLLLDGRLRVPASAALFRPDPEWGGTLPDGPSAEQASGLGRTGTWILCRRGARGLRSARARADQVLEIAKARDGHVDLRKAMTRLGAEGLTSVLVEGGGQLAAALLRSDLVDEVHWMLAPKLIGGDGRTVLGELGLDRLTAAPEIETRSIRRRGPDLHWHGVIRQDGDGASRQGAASRKKQTANKKGATR